MCFMFPRETPRRCEYSQNELQLNSFPPSSPSLPPLPPPLVPSTSPSPVPSSTPPSPPPSLLLPCLPPTTSPRSFPASILTYKPEGTRVNIEISEMDLDCLEPNVYLNDRVIDFYLMLVHTPWPHSIPLLVAPFHYSSFPFHYSPFYADSIPLFHYWYIAPCYYSLVSFHSTGTGISGMMYWEQDRGTEYISSALSFTRDSWTHHVTSPIKS